MAINTTKLLQLFKKFGYKLKDLTDIFETTEQRVKDMLKDKKVVVLDIDEAERLLKYISASDAIGLMPAREVVRIVGR